MTKIKKILFALITLMLVIAGYIYYLGISFFWDHSISERISALDALDTKLFDQGAAEMRKHKVIICGIVRDDALYFGQMRRYIEYIGEQFKDYKVIIFENDSKDCTKVLLSMWQKQNDRVKVISKDFHNTKRPNIKFLADARNYYIQEIQQDHQYDDFDIMMPVDMDMAYGFDIRSVQHSFAHFYTWDVICSNGIGMMQNDVMWDAFAFRSDEFPYAPHEIGIKEYWSKTIYAIQKRYDASEPLLPVQSCFGGLAFYKREKTTGCVYDSVQNDCEHVAFHRCIREKNHGLIFMNPAQIVRHAHYSIVNYIARMLVFKQFDLCSHPSQIY